jgi:hypothetical protein
MAAVMIQGKRSAVSAYRANRKGSFAIHQRIASMNPEEKTAAIRGLGAIKQETIGLRLARAAMFDELPGLVYAIVTTLFVLKFLSGHL